MLKPTNDPHEVLEGDASLFGPGWREVVTFDDLTDEEEYTSDEEEFYAIFDMGQALDGKTLQRQATFQLIGLDTPVPFIKLGNQVYQGELGNPIGDEVVLGKIRNTSNPSKPTHPPSFKIDRQILFHPVDLLPRVSQTANGTTGPTANPAEVQDVVDDDDTNPEASGSKHRSIFMQGPAPFGPNRGRRDEVLESNAPELGPTGRKYWNTKGKGKSKEKDNDGGEALNEQEKTLDSGKSRGKGKEKEKERSASAVPAPAVPVASLSPAPVAPSVEAGDDTTAKEKSKANARGVKPSGKGKGKGKQKAGGRDDPEETVEVEAGSDADDEDEPLVEPSFASGPLSGPALSQVERLSPPTPPVVAPSHQHQDTKPVTDPRQISPQNVQPGAHSDTSPPPLIRPATSTDLPPSHHMQSSTSTVPDSHPAPPPALGSSSSRNSNTPQSAQAGPSSQAGPSQVPSYSLAPSPHFPSNVSPYTSHTPPKLSLPDPTDPANSSALFTGEPLPVPYPAKVESRSPSQTPLIPGQRSRGRPQGSLMRPRYLFSNEEELYKYDLSAIPANAIVEFPLDDNEKGSKRGMYRLSAHQVQNVMHGIPIRGAGSRRGKGRGAELGEAGAKFLLAVEEKKVESDGAGAGAGRSREGTTVSASSPAPTLTRHEQGSSRKENSPTTFADQIATPAHVRPEPSHTPTHNLPMSSKTSPAVQSGNTPGLLSSTPLAPHTPHTPRESIYAANRVLQIKTVDTTSSVPHTPTAGASSSSSRQRGNNKGKAKAPAYPEGPAFSVGALVRPGGLAPALAPAPAPPHTHARAPPQPHPYPHQHPHAPHSSMTTPSVDAHGQRFWIPPGGHQQHQYDHCQHQHHQQHYQHQQQQYYHQQHQHPQQQQYHQQQLYHPDGRGGVIGSGHMPPPYGQHRPVREGGGADRPIELDGEDGSERDRAESPEMPLRSIYDRP